MDSQGLTHRLKLARESLALTLHCEMQLKNWVLPSIKRSVLLRLERGNLKPQK